MIAAAIITTPPEMRKYPKNAAIPPAPATRIVPSVNARAAKRGSPDNRTETRTSPPEEGGGTAGLEPSAGAWTSSHHATDHMGCVRGSHPTSALPVFHSGGCSPGCTVAPEKGLEKVAGVAATSRVPQMDLASW